MTEFELQLFNRYINSTNYHYVVPFELKKSLYLEASNAIKLNKKDLVYQYPQDFCVEFATRHNLKPRNYDFEEIEKVVYPIKSKYLPKFIEYDLNEDTATDEDLDIIKYMHESYMIDKDEPFKIIED